MLKKDKESSKKDETPKKKEEAKLSPPKKKKAEAKKEEVKEEVKKEPEKAPEPESFAPAVSFNRWFRSRSKARGFKPHWVAGMRKYADISGRHSLEQWDLIFKDY